MSDNAISFMIIFGVLFGTVFICMIVQYKRIDVKRLVGLCAVWAIAAAVIDWILSDTAFDASAIAIPLWGLSLVSSLLAALRMLFPPKEP